MVKLVRADFRLYLIVSRNDTLGGDLLRFVDDVLSATAGPDQSKVAIQLREKKVHAREVLAIAKELRELTFKYKARLIINERTDVALASEADGVHLPLDGVSVNDARSILGAGKLIGSSTHTLEEAASAQAGGADFITFGPVYSTPSKLKYGAPPGVERLGEVSAKIKIPVFALGGITLSRINEVSGAGAFGVGVISAISDAKDVGEAASAFITKLNNFK